MNFFPFCSHILPLATVILLNCEAFAESTNNAVLDTSKVPGVVIDHSPKSSGKYIGSPSIAILPNGDYLEWRALPGPLGAAAHPAAAGHRVHRARTQPSKSGQSCQKFVIAKAES